MESLWLLGVFVLALAAIGLGLGAWLASSRRRRRRAVYQAQLEAAVADGVLNPDEVRHLEQLRAGGALSDAEARMAALAVYRRALAAAVADARVTADEAATLAQMQKLLGLTDADLADEAHHKRMRLLAQLEAGGLPLVASPIPLASGEVAHWTVQATLCERMAFPGRPAPDPPHVLLQIPGSEPFSAAGERHTLGTSPQLLPIDLGVLVVSARAVRFRGAKTEVIIDHSRLRAIALFQDGLRLDVVEPEGSRYFLVSDPELTAAVALLAARARQYRTAG